MFYWPAALVLAAVPLILIKNISIALSIRFRYHPFQLVVEIFLWPGRRCLRYDLGGQDLLNMPLQRSPFWPARLLSRYRPTMQAFVHHALIDNFTWKSTLGLGDAMQTALCTGTLWSLKGSAVSFLSRRMRVKRVALAVKPDFTSRQCTSSLDCIFKIRLVHYINIMAMIWLRRRRTSHGRAAARQQQSPYRGVNENRYAEY